MNKDGDYVITKGETYVDNLLDNISINDHSFRLEMIIHHTGSNSNDGHYYTHRFINNLWYEFDDQQVSGCSFNTMKEKLNEKVQNTSANLLVYYKLN